MPVYTVSPTISTSAYSTGDVVGGILTIKKALSRECLLTHISVFDDDGEGVQLDFFFFNAALTGTYTDNAAFAIDAADKSKWIGCTSVLAADYLAAGSDKVITKSPINLDINFGANGDRNLYAVCVIRSTTTYTATTDLRFDFGVIPR